MRSFFSFTRFLPRLRFVGLAFLLPATLLLASCAALSPEECATADWYGLGVKDGSQGREDKAADYLKACSKASIGIDLGRYRSGRAEGLQSYCQLDNAVREGLAGSSYGGVCPAGSMDANFRQVHGIALQEYQARRFLAGLQNDQNQWQAELQNSKTTEERRRLLREQLQRADQRIDIARDELRRAQFQLDRLRQDLRRSGAVPF